MAEVDLSMNLNDLLDDLEKGIIMPGKVASLVRFVAGACESLPGLEAIIIAAAAMKNGKPKTRRPRKLAPVPETDWNAERRATLAKLNAVPPQPPTSGSVSVESPAPARTRKPRADKGRKRGPRLPEEKGEEMTDAELAASNVRGDPE
jgi:hypothetical protein